MSAGTVANAAAALGGKGLHANVNTPDAVPNSNGAENGINNANKPDETKSSPQIKNLDTKIVASKIAGGHAFEKHVIKQKEFPDITTNEQFQQHIENIMNNPSDVRNLERGRMAWWDDDSGTVVIFDPNHKDKGSAFKPDTGKDYFLRVLK